MPEPQISTLHWPDWKAELRASFTSLDELAREGWVGLGDPGELPRLRLLGERFRVRIPRAFAALMDPSDPHCPIRLQAIPGLCEEDPELPSWATEASLRAYGRSTPWHGDAIGDLSKLAAPRLTHRYGNRAILHLAQSCAMYCRFCFRKTHLSRSEADLYGGPLDPAIEYLRGKTEIRELVLTGGDPLSLSDGALTRVLERLAGIAHLRVVRLHSRMPATLPSRLDEGLARALGGGNPSSGPGWPFRVHLASHFNHPRELTPGAREGLRRMAASGVTLFNQSVLLRRVNDRPELLAELYQELYELGVRPFYLHHPDWTPGTFGFRVSIARGREIFRALRGLVSGPALPEYVLDLPQGHGKIAVQDSENLVARESLENMGGGIGGTLYEAFGPRTRAPKADAPILYLDLWPTSDGARLPEHLV